MRRLTMNELSRIDGLNKVLEIDPNDMDLIELAAGNMKKFISKGRLKFLYSASGN